MDSLLPQRWCESGHFADEVLFHVHHRDWNSNPVYRAKCDYCRQTKRDLPKQNGLGRMTRAMEDRTRKHAEKSFGVPVQALIDHGWVANEMATDAIHAFSAGCRNGCHKKFRNESDLQIDIKNPDEWDAPPEDPSSWTMTGARLPSYPADVWFLCGTCNRKKGRKSAAEWTRYCRAMRAAEAALEAALANPQLAGRLF